MSPKAHGTTASPVQQKLRWGVDRETADRICSYNRHYAEYAGYFKSTDFMKDMQNAGVETTITYYDSVSGKPLFVAPRGAFSPRRYFARSTILPPTTPWAGVLAF
jgi:hypothetical protein